MTSSRDRGWRRAKKRQNKGKEMGGKKLDKPQKNWKLLVLRSEKVARAKQLGFDYPKRHQQEWLAPEDETDD